MDTGKILDKGGKAGALALLIIWGAVIEFCWFFFSMVVFKLILRLNAAEGIFWTGFFIIIGLASLIVKMSRGYIGK